MNDPITRMQLSFGVPPHEVRPTRELFGFLFCLVAIIAWFTA